MHMTHAQVTELAALAELHGGRDCGYKLSTPCGRTIVATVYRAQLPLGVIVLTPFSSGRWSEWGSRPDG